MGYSVVISTIGNVIGIPKVEMAIGLETKGLAGLLLPFFLVEDLDDSIFSNHFLEHNCIYYQ